MVGNVNQEELMKSHVMHNLPGRLRLAASGLKYLKEQGLSGCMVENCGLPNQRVYHTVEEIPEDAGYFSLLIVKGEGK